ncbi:universal stress protein [Streptomyces ossamyceticus]|uniref:Universal stress protein n=1 Tax=Streptomyces ossamyceticus TaxID=249581 RepID=A0ABV2V5W8_9ACTN
MQPVVTVGLDGSPESLTAARWAADEAEKRKLTLRLLHAWPMLVPEPTRGPAEVDQNYWAKRLVHTAQSELQTRHPGLTVVGSLVAEDAREALLRAASDSEMLVLGSRRLETFSSYFLGDVSLPVVARASRPVVVVRTVPEKEHPPPATANRVVVAVEPRGSSDELLDFAFHTAAARGAPLLAVLGRSVPLHARTPWGVDHDVTEEITRNGQKELGKVLRPWQEKYPGVDVSDSVRLTSPAKAVVEATVDAGLLVVGRRVHQHAHTGPLLSHVAHAALHHGRCPVAVVPHT